jgi:hypothetical protein
MGRKRKEQFGAVAWYVHRTGVNYAGKLPVESKFGPFPSRRKAEDWWREDEERPGKEGYEYTYVIENVPTALMNLKKG